MLTVDYAKLGVRPGDRLLDLGCGFGRHAFEAARRGARVVACDMSDAELKEVRATFGAMAEAGQVAEEGCTGAVNGDAVHLPFTDAAFDRVIASEVMEHIPNDSGAMHELARVLRPGGTIAVTVPAWLPEKVCWMLSDEYHAPFVEGGHVRIYTEDELRVRMRSAGLVPGASHPRTRCTAPTGGCGARSGRRTRPTRPSWPIASSSNGTSPRPRSRLAPRTAS